MNGSALIKKTSQIMFGDAGVSGTAQYMSQLVWILFLKVFDYKEEEWELEDDYVPVIPAPFRFRDWAAPKNADGSKDLKNRLTGDNLIYFVNNVLFPFLQGNEVDYNNTKYIFLSTDVKANVVKEFMLETSNYMKDGVKLRQVVDVIAEIDFDNSERKHEFNDFYEGFLQELQNGGKATGEFYTPRAVTRFITDHIAPKLGEKVADFACGTGGFLAEAINALQKQVKTSEDTITIQNTIYGIEFKQLPYMLATTNMYLHDINNPQIVHGDGLGKDVLNLSDDDYFDCILMNPPFGGNFDKKDLNNFPTELASMSTADMFVTRIIYCLKKGGRCGLILPDTLFIGVDNKQIELKKRLLKECNLHTVIRLPSSVFSPYSAITTNLLFFEKTGPTKDVWFYRMDMPEGRLHFNKTHPITREDMAVVDEWWDNRVEIKDEKADESMTETWKSKKISIQEIEERNYDLDICGYPQEEEIILSPEETIRQYVEKKQLLEAKLNTATTAIEKFLNGNNTKLFSMKEVTEEITKLDMGFPEQIYKSVLLYAMQGKITEQLSSDTSVDIYLEKANSKKEELRKAGNLFYKKGNNAINDIGLFDIPNSWRWVYLSDVADFKLGKSPAKVDVYSWGNDYKWVQIADLVNNSTVSDTKKEISEYGFENTFKKHISPKGTLLMSFKLTIGKVSILDVDAVHNEAIISIFPFVNDDNITRDYLFKILPYVSKSGDFKTAIKGKTLNSSSLANLMIPLPPIEEQRRIVSKLDEVLPIITGE